MYDSASIRLPPARLASFGRCEEGAGTAFGMFGILICLMFAGLSIDATNAWRNGEILRLSADVAAHAGASRLAQKGDRTAALAVAAGATELNTPTAVYGRTIYDPFENIEALHYDPETNMVSSDGTANAVSVRLERTDRVKNPVPTFLLRLVGQEAWNLSVTSVAAVVPTERCHSGDGIFSHDAVVLAGEALVGSDVCIHSQRKVQLSGRSSFEKDSGLSMPDLADCQGGCSDISSPGFALAAAEANLIMPDPATHIDKLSQGFADPDTKLAEEMLFFAAHPLADDLSALEEVGIDTMDLVGGDVVSLKASEFARTRALPEGLVYVVTCPSDGDGRLDIGGRAVEQTDGMTDPDVDSPEASGDETVQDGDAPPPDEAAPGDPVTVEGQLLNGIVLVTDCRLHFTDLADIRGSLILSTKAVSGVALSADEGASAGDPHLACNPAMQSMIMAKGSMQVPARFTASNTAFVIAGEIVVAGDPSGAAVRHRGLSLHAGGPVQMKGAHSFEACGTALEPLLPELNVIKYVIPTDPLIVTN